jgi:putative (di)nucleoside polyphosphate hydrolase
MPARLPRYRLNVAAMLLTPDGDLLVCERLHLNGAWQFPQGGVDRGESLEEAITRELQEEIGVTADQWIELRQIGPLRYHFGGGREIRGFHGKDQHFFLLEYFGDPLGIEVRQPDQEFGAFQWIRPEEFQLSWLPETKREMYQQAFTQLLGLPLR